MATLPTLVPNGTPTNLTSDWDANTNTFTAIDELIASADGVEVGDDSNVAGDHFGYWLLTNMPTDFSSMDTISYQIRYRVIGAQTNNRSLFIQVVTDEVTPTALTNEATVATNITNTTATNSSVVGLTIQGTPTKAQWDNAVVRCRLAITKNKGGDTNGIRVDAINFTGTYTQAAAPQVVAANQATETDAAQPVTFSKAATATQSAEVDLAQPVASAKTTGTTQSAETDAAQPIAYLKTTALTQAAETDVARPVAVAKTQAVTQATETDAAVPLASVVAVAQAAETDAAQPVTLVRVLALTQAAEADVAFPVTRPTALTATVNQASETDASGPAERVGAPGMPNPVNDLACSGGDAQVVLAWSEPVGVA